MARADEASGERAPRGWFGVALRPFNFIALLRERQQIRRICSELLEVYWRMAQEMPGASSREIYGRVIGGRIGGDSQAVQSVMRRAEESFATWPVERSLNFRDIAQYIVITGGLTEDIAVTGVRSRFVDSVFAIVAEVIPANL